MIEILAVLFFTLGVLFFSLTVFVDSFAESVTKSKVRICEIKKEYEEKIAFYEAKAKETEQKLNEKIEELTTEIKVLELAEQNRQITLNEAHQKENQNIIDPKPIDTDMYEQYKTLCDNEKLAIIAFANEIESCLKEKSENLTKGIKIGRLHNFFYQDKDYYIKDLKITATIDKIHPQEDDKAYTTTLSTCDCDDVKKNHVPACKHMLFLAYSLGVLQLYRNKNQTYFDELIRDAKKAKSDGKNNGKKNSSPEPKTNYIRGSEEFM